MPPPTNADLLNVWDKGERASQAERALLLLQTVRPEPGEQLAGMPLGWVTVQLLKIRAAMMGPTLVCLANCTKCDTIVECEIEIEQLTAMAKGNEAGGGGPLVIRHAGYVIEYRLPTCADLLALRGDPRAAALTLAGRLIGRATRSGGAIPPADLPAEFNAALESAVLENDPLAHLELGLECPSCGLRWTEALPVIDFVWSELTILAQRVLHDVARLAYAFGWRESDILAMTDQRRKRYLELLPA